MRNRLKIKNLGGKTSVLLKCPKNKQLCARSAEMINRPGSLFAPLTVAGSEKAPLLVYDVDGCVTLRAFLSGIIGRGVFSRIVSDSLKVIKKTSEEYFCPDSLLLETDDVFISLRDWRLRFIYVPVQNFESGTGAKEYFTAIAEAAVFSEDEDIGFVSDYIGILNKRGAFSVFDLEELIASSETETPPAAIPEAADTPEPVSEADFEEPPFPTVSRIRTGEAFSLEKVVTRIGKSRTHADIFLADNPTISRVHAVIELIGGKYYLSDNSSLNKTYVERAELPPGVKKELGDKTVFSLSDEDFIFRR